MDIVNLVNTLLFVLCWCQMSLITLHAVVHCVIGDEV